MDIFNSISSEFLSASSGVSTCKSVPVVGSQTIGNGTGGGPHSSMNEPFSGVDEVNQKDVARESSARESTRNLLSRALSGTDGEGMISHGTITKSSGMRLENWRRRSHVPEFLSCDSSYVCRSIRRVDEDISEWMWWCIAERWRDGQIRRTSGIY